MFFLCSEFSSPCQASRAIFKPSLPINPSPCLTDGGWWGERMEGRKTEGRYRNKQKTNTKKGCGGGGGDWGTHEYTHSCES